MLCKTKQQQAAFIGPVVRKNKYSILGEEEKMQMVRESQV